MVEDAPHKSTLEVLHGLLHKHHRRRITAKQGAIMLTRQEVESSASPSVFSGGLVLLAFTTRCSFFAIQDLRQQRSSIGRPLSPKA